MSSWWHLVIRAYVGATAILLNFLPACHLASPFRDEYLHICHCLFFSVSATTIRRRTIDSVAANSREHVEARSVRRLEEVPSHFDSPALLARNWSRRDATDVLLEVAVASIVIAHSMCGTLLCV